MAKRASGGLSHEQKAFLWSRWKAGDSVSDGGFHDQIRFSFCFDCVACFGQGA